MIYGIIGAIGVWLLIGLWTLLRILSVLKGLKIEVEKFLQPQFNFYIGDKRVKYMQLKDNQSLPLTLTVEDKFGNPTPAPLDAAPAWALDDPSFGTLTPAADGMSASFVPNGKLGNCNVQVSGAIAGAAVAGALPVSVIAGDASQIAITPGTPVNQ